MFAVYTQTLVRVLVSFLLAQSWAATLLAEKEWHLARLPNSLSTALRPWPILRNFFHITIQEKS